MKCNSEKYKSQPIRTWIVSWIGWLIIHFIGITSRVKIIESEGFSRLKNNGSNFIYAFWHGRQLFLIYNKRFQKICVLISQSQDGEYIARIANRFGIQSVRGSTSHGGRRAIVKMNKKAKDDFILAFSPDGPRGPFRKVQPGVIFTAQKARIPIVPLVFSARRKKILGRWDRYMIPYPFNSIVIINGEPFFVSEEDSLDEKSKELEKALNSISEQADLLVQS